MIGDVKMRLAYVYFRQGKWEESVSEYKLAYRHYKDGGKSFKEIEAMMMCANSYRNATEYSEAIALFEKIEKAPIYGQLKGNAPILFTNILMYYGWTLHSAGKYKAADKYLIEAEKMLLETDVCIPIKDIAQIYYLRAVGLFNQSEYAAAEEYCEKSLNYVRQAYGENSVEICSALNQLGAIVQKQNNHEKAIRLFNESFKIRLNYYGENNLFTSISLRNYAKALIRRGNPKDLEEVGKAFELVRTIREQLAESGKGLGWLAQIYLDLADYNQKIKDYFQAETLVRKSHELYIKHGTARDVSTCDLQLGIIKYATGNYDEAKHAFIQAIELSKEYYSPEHPYSKELQEWINKCILAESSNL
jgi:tetratricopeptide (TPR) repeat protein